LDKLEQAQKDKENFIDPNDKTKLEAAAKNAGLGFSQGDIDKAVQAEKDKMKEMVSKEDYDKALAEKEARPNTTLEEYQKLQNNQEKHKPEDLEHHKPEDLKPANLPAN